MAGRQPDSTVSVHAGAPPIRLIGDLCTRAGLILGVPSLLVLLGSLPVLFTASVPSTAARLLDVAAGPAATLSGVEVAAHAAAVGVLAACWLLGVGLLIDGVFDGPK